LPDLTTRASLEAIDSVFLVAFDFLVGAIAAVGVGGEAFWRRRGLRRLSVYSFAYGRITPAITDELYSSAQRVPDSDQMADLDLGFGGGHGGMSSADSLEDCHFRLQTFRWLYGESYRSSILRNARQGQAL
jgi:hypothetical protein